MSKPTEEAIMNAYLADMQRELAQGEKLKQQTESLRTENWTLEKRNEELKTTITDIENRAQTLKINEEDFNKRYSEFDQKEKAFRNEQSAFYQKELKLSNDLNNFEALKVEQDKREKDLIDKEKAVDAREYEVEIDKGKLEQKLKAYRDKLSLN